MTAETDIGNLALGRIKQSTIASFDEDSTEAMECSRLYPISRDYVLADFPWRVNTFLQTLAPLTNDRECEWRFKYQRPTCLRQRYILNKYGRHNPRNPVRFEQNAAGIYCNVENARALIQTQITDTTLYSPALVSHIAWRLAYELVGPLEADMGLMQWAQKKYDNEKAEARDTEAAEEYLTDEVGSGRHLPEAIACRE